LKTASHRLRVPDQVAGTLRNLHPQLKKKVRVSLKMILADPYSGKALKEELSGLRSFRVGRFRIIYRIAAGKEIEIVTIGPRESIYRETYLLLRKNTRNDEKA
jgi:mRNA interferase RelE/StbE